MKKSMLYVYKLIIQYGIPSELTRNLTCNQLKNDYQLLSVVNTYRIKCLCKELASHSHTCQGKLIYNY